MTSHARLAGPNRREGHVESDTDSAVSEIFSDNGSDSDSNGELEDSKESDDNNEQEDQSLNDEGQLSPEHYLAEAENLDVSQLRQKRYSDTTQEKIDGTRVYWDR